MAESEEKPCPDCERTALRLECIARRAEKGLKRLYLDSDPLRKVLEWIRDEARRAA